MQTVAHLRYSGTEVASLNAMKNLAPEIMRQRLLIEGTYSAELDQDRIEAYLIGITQHLDLRSYGKPTIHATRGAGKAENAGYDAFIPLIDSGISLYVWSEKRFFASLLFTCKEFDIENAVSYTRDFFRAGELVHLSF